MRAFISAAITGCFLVHEAGIAWGQYGAPTGYPSPNNFAPPASAAPYTNTPQSIPWLDSLDQAMAIARTEQKPILVHYWNTNCLPCLKLEQTSFRDPGIIRLMAINYIPVKLNTDLPQNQELARRMQVMSWPTDVILSPDGREIAKFNTPQEAMAYGIQLERIAADLKARNAASNLARNAWPVGGPNPSMAPQPQSPSYPPAMTNNVPPWANDPRMASESRYNMPSPAATQPRYSDAPAVGPEFPPPQETRNPYDTPPPARNAYDNPPPTEHAQPAPATPSAVLDGHCPVTLVERKVWKRADPQWGAVHRGRTYLFASPAEQQRFLANPDRFSPMLSGYDPVVFVEQGKLVEGRRQHGLFFQDGIFLFTSEDSLRRFQEVPGKYVPAVKQAMTASTRK